MFLDHTLYIYIYPRTETKNSCTVNKFFFQSVLVKSGSHECVETLVLPLCYTVSAILVLNVLRIIPHTHVCTGTFVAYCTRCCYHQLRIFNMDLQRNESP